MSVVTIKAKQQPGKTVRSLQLPPCHKNEKRPPVSHLKKCLRGFDYLHHKRDKVSVLLSTHINLLPVSMLGLFFLFGRSHVIESFATINMTKD